MMYPLKLIIIEDEIIVSRQGMKDTEYMIKLTAAGQLIIGCKGKVLIAKRNYNKELLFIYTSMPNKKPKRR